MGGRTRAGLTAALLASTCLTGAAWAQSEAAPPPVRSTIDGNGVDLVTGALRLAVRELSIGPDGPGGLAYTRYFTGTGWRDDFVGTIQSSGSLFTVSMGGASETFTQSGTTFTSEQGQGSTLSFDSTAQSYTYTTADGIVGVFEKPLFAAEPYQANEGRIISLAYPSGERMGFTYASVFVCPPANRVRASRLSSAPTA